MKYAPSTFDHFIDGYRQFLAEVCAGVPGSAGVFSDAPGMPLTPVQHELWRRVKNAEQPADILPAHCEMCAEEWREDMRVAMRQIDRYLAGELGDTVIKCVLATYRSAQEGIGVAVYDDGNRVWARGAQGLGEEVQAYLQKNDIPLGAVIDSSVLPRHINEFTLEATSGIQTLFSREV